VYERHDEPILPLKQFLVRFARHGKLAGAVVLFSLAIGTLGFSAFDGQQWLDGFVNASMLLGGMGLVGELHTSAGKVFASFYALYAGIVFIGTAGLLLAPVVHRILHVMHLGERRAQR
jgi:hypothetical protein